MSQSVIYRQIPPADPALVRQAGDYAVSDLHEAMGPVAGRMALMNPAIRMLWPGARLVGQAVTVHAFPGDALPMHKAVQLAGAGQVIVVSGGGLGCAMLGDLMAAYAQSRGIAGMVIEGAVRDSDRLAELRFPVWALCATSAHNEKRGPAAINVPIVCGGVLVQPGDVIVADGDGVLAIPRRKLASTVTAAAARADKEEKIRQRIAAGESLFDIMRVQALVEAAGMVEREGTWLDAEEEA